MTLGKPDRNVLAQGPTTVWGRTPSKDRDPVTVFPLPVGRGPTDFRRIEWERFCRKGGTIDQTI
jgi:hypothetical protein